MGNLCEFNRRFIQWHSKSCYFLYTSGALPPQGLCFCCSLEPENSSRCLHAFLYPSLLFCKSLLTCHLLSEDFPSTFAYLTVAFSFFLLYSTYHLITWYIVYLFLLSVFNKYNKNSIKVGIFFFFFVFLSILFTAISPESDCK